MRINNTRKRTATGNRRSSCYVDAHARPDQSLASGMRPPRDNRLVPHISGSTFLSLWDEYEKAASPEAIAVKALDKLETLIQHNQGTNPPDFVDDVFNLSYGKKYTDAVPLFAEIRRLIDEDTQRRAAGAGRKI